MTIEIPGTLTSFNVHEKAARTGWKKAALIKKAETERVAEECYLVKKEKLNYPVNIKFTWYLPNRKIDKDNIAFAKKYILDGLVMGGVLPNDTWEYIGDFSDSFSVDEENPRIEITML